MTGQPPRQAGSAIARHITRQRRAEAKQRAKQGLPAVGDGHNDPGRVRDGSTSGEKHLARLRQANADDTGGQT